MDWGPRKGGQGKGGKATRFAVKGAAGRGKGGFGPSAGWEFQDFVQTVLRFQQQSDVSKNSGVFPQNGW